MSPTRSTAPPIRLGSTRCSTIGSPSSLPRRLSTIRATIAASERRGGGQPHGDAAAQLVVQDVRLAVDRPQAIEPSVPGHDLEEVDQHGDTRPPKHLVDQCRLFLGQHQDRVQNGLQLRKPVDHVGHHGVELLDHRRRLAGPLGRVEQGLGVHVGDVLDADVGLHLGRGAGMFGGDVAGFRHEMMNEAE